MKTFSPSGLRIKINTSCKVNDIDFNIMGNGLIKPQGVYSAKLEFSEIPPKFHPVIVSGYTVSLCCGYASAVRNNAVNMLNLGINKYRTERKLTLANGDKIEINGRVAATKNDVNFEGMVDGICDVPKDIVPFAYYNTCWIPAGYGRVVGKGVGSFFRVNGEEIPVEIGTKYFFDKQVVLKKAQFGIITESGSLDGLVYTSVLHSVRDRENTMTKLMPLESFST